MGEQMFFSSPQSCGKVLLTRFRLDITVPISFARLGILCPRNHGETGPPLWGG